MTGWAAKRFWKEVTTSPSEAGFGVFLDGRPIKTPAKVTIALPTKALAEAVAEEWDAVDEVIDPNRMPMTRSANAAIDKVMTQFDEVAAMVAEYGGSDLICYRADGPDLLCQRQAEAWDPMLDWAAEEYGARLRPVVGVMPVAQDPAALAAMHDAVRAQSAFQLTALHDMVGLTGSLVIGLAMSRGQLGADAAWQMSRIDEAWQIEQWGPDADAEDTAARKLDELRHAERLYAIAS